MLNIHHPSPSIRFLEIPPTPSSSATCTPPSSIPPLNIANMSTSNQIPSPSTNNFTAIFNAASTEYEAVTGNRLDTHPFAAQLHTCHSPEDISNILRTQAQGFSKFCEGDEKLMAWLGPTIYILFTFSATLGEGVGLVSHLDSFGMTAF